MHLQFPTTPPAPGDESHCSGWMGQFASSGQNNGKVLLLHVVGAQAWHLFSCACDTHRGVREEKPNDFSEREPFL